MAPSPKVLGLLALACARPPHALDLEYSLFFAEDPQHRGLARITGEAGVATPVVFSARERTRHVALADGGPAGQLTAMVRQGAFHIWQGLDHLLFLVALLLPCVLRRDAQGWTPRAGFGPVLRDVLKIVTAFTVAHSLTLSLAALDVVRLPVRWVEAGVALSVVVAALNNVRPFLRDLRWVAGLRAGAAARLRLQRDAGGPGALGGGARAHAARLQRGRGAGAARRGGAVPAARLRPARLGGVPARGAGGRQRAHRAARLRVVPRARLRAAHPRPLRRGPAAELTRVAFSAAGPRAGRAARGGG
ncbi:HupE/UreJ family protein [Aggregicoccus sp. 17bor-14]|nr:HupE/UreJ family protein [Aggregicoccus sp. 17bor-14]